MFHSSFEKYRENDIPIHQFPIHAEDYAEQIVWLDSHNRLSAEDKLRLIAQRILNHWAYPENWNACELCKKEPMNDE